MLLIVVCRKLYTIIILPSLKSVKYMFDYVTSDVLSLTPLNNKTVSRRLNEIAWDADRKLYNHLHINEIAQLLNEWTNYSFILCHRWCTMEELLFTKLLITHALAKIKKNKNFGKYHYICNKWCTSAMIEDQCDFINIYRIINFVSVTGNWLSNISMID